MLVIFFSQAITGNMRALELSCKRSIQRNQLHRNLLKTLTQSCQFAVVLDYWPISENSCGFSNNLCELCLIVLHPALEQWECYVRQSVLYVLLSKVHEHMCDYCYFIKPFLSFWFCFICSIGFGFPFFMLTPWFVAVMFWIQSLLYSVGLLVGHQLILFRLNHIEKFVISHGDICFSEDIMPAVGEGSVINNAIMCRDLLAVNAPGKVSTKKIW